MAITYTPSVNFGAKDSLPVNDPSKVIKGSEFTTEFTAIQTAFGLAAPAASPTFTGTVTISSVDINGGVIDGTTIGGTTPAAGTFSSLTATTADINGGTLDGVTIGGSSAGAGSFTTLTASGDANFDSGTFFVDASANAVGIGTTSPVYDAHIKQSASYGLGVESTSDDSRLLIGNVSSTWRIAATYDTGGSFQPITFFTSDTERMRIDSSGNVGIGATSSLKKLTVQGSTTDRTVEVIDNGSNDAAIMLQLSGTQEFTLGVDRTDSSFRIADSGALGTNDRLVINSSGNVGIGTTSPTGVLTSYKSSNGDPVLGHFYNDNAGTATEATVYVTNSSSVSDGLFLQTTGPAFTTVGGFVQDGSVIGSGTGASGGLSIMTRANADMRFYTNGHTNERMRIDSSGNLLVGDTTYRLSGITATGQAIQLGSRTFIGTDSSGDTRLGGLSGSNITVFYQNGSEAARIDSSGNLLVGTTSNLGYGGSVILKNGSNLNALAVINSATSNPYGPAIVFSGAAPNDATRYFLNCSDTIGTRAAILSNGGIANYQANDTNLSDERVKTDIAPLGSMWDKFKALEIVTFKYKDQTHDDDNIGVIAQQVEAVAPEFVDNDGFGETPEGEEPLKAIYTADLYHAAIKALQEAMARIETLEAEVAALKGA